MQPVYVQQIDGAIGEIGQRLIECGAKELGESRVACVMKATEVLENLLTVMSRMRIASPCIDRVASGIQARQDNALAESSVGDSVMGAELYDHTRPQDMNQPMCEGHVCMPAAWQLGACIVPEQRIERPGCRARQGLAPGPD